MAIVAPVAPSTVSPLPVPPSSTSPMDFDPRADAFLGALPTNQTQMNSLGTNVYDNALKTYNSANDTTTAATSAVNASNTANNAAILASQSLADMQKLYLGSKSVPPSTDNQGNPLQVGAWFVNASQGYWYWWSGTDWKLGVSDLSSVDWATQVTGKPNTLSGYGIVNQSQARLDLGLKSAAVADVLGIVSQIGGTPTGAIIQRGSNANGEFTRYADGTQECWMDHVFDAAINVTDGALFLSARVASWTFPVAFIAAPKVISQSTGAGALGLYPASDAISNSSVDGVYLVSSSSRTSAQRKVTRKATGRWF